MDKFTQLRFLILLMQKRLDRFKILEVSYKALGVPLLLCKS